MKLFRLGLMAQFTAITIIIPGPVLLIIGPFFLYLLAALFVGKKLTGLLIVFDFIINFPQSFGNSSTSVAGANAGISGIKAVASPGSPLAVFFNAHEILTVVLLGASLVAVAGLLYLDVVLAWRRAKLIARRVPRSLWA